MIYFTAMKSSNTWPIWLFLTVVIFSCEQNAETSGYQGQGPNPLVSTETVPVQAQWKGTWSFQDSTVFFTNDFPGGRLNGVAQTGEDHYTLLITAENYPINQSPWYAFKVWGKEKGIITLKLQYLESRSRYYPKLSTDGLNFYPLDSGAYRPLQPGEGEFGIESAPGEIEMDIEITPEPLWVSAQELWNSPRVKSWVDAVSSHEDVQQEVVGLSREKRPIWMMKVGNENSKKALFIISRQHPPEVTGFLAMKSFIERILEADDSANNFRSAFVTYVIPLMNPDGVDNGHWRHNMGGIDLNRDWQEFNQPETSAARAFLNEKKAEGVDFVFGADFHSTWDDIYYPLDSSITKKDDLIIYEWIKRINDRLPQKRTNISPSAQLEPTMVSRNYFYLNHDMPAIVFELGDNTPRDFLQQKGSVAAEEIMELLSKRHL